MRRIEHSSAAFAGIRRDKSGRLFLPCYAAFNDLLAAIDPHQLARVLNEGLAQNEGTLPRSLAIDGNPHRRENRPAEDLHPSFHHQPAPRRGGREETRGTHPQPLGSGKP